MSIHRRSRPDHLALVVGIDLAKMTHVAVFESPDGTFSKPLPFKNSRAGFEKLQTSIETLARRTGTKHVVVGYESTGHYGKPLEEWLESQSYDRVLVSALHTKRAKDMLDNSPLKTDAKDAAVIADLTRQGFGKPVVRREAVYVELRLLLQVRARLIRERTANFNRVHRVLDTLFPELLALFSTLDGKAVQALLTETPTPDQVLAQGLPALEQLLRKHSRGRLGLARAKAIFDVAATSIACRSGSRIQALELKLLLPRIAELARQLDEVECEMTRLLDAIPYAKLLTAIPYVGTVTVAAMLGELGDLRTYRSARQVVKMAGLALYEKSSGLRTGQRHITKRGRSQLRQILYLCASRMLAKGRPLYPLLLRSEGKPFPKVAVAGMRRLLRMMHAVVRDEKPFNPDKLIAMPLAEPGDKKAA